MTVDSDNELENQFAEWRAYVHRRRELHQADAEELEDHLRGRIAELTEAGLQPTRRSWSRSSGWAASTSCPASSPGSTPSGCGSSWC